MAIAEQRLSALHQADPELASLLEAELDRQQYTLELIPSENVASPAVLEAVGSWLTDKYAEGTPGKRYYGGCEFVDQIETLAQERACALFWAEHANVQPHCGSSANLAAYMAFCHAEFYGVSRETEQLDYEEIRRRAHEVRPRVLVAGASAYPRIFDFPQLAEIAHEVDAVLMVDMAHFAGLVAGGAHPSPVPYADVVTLTTHKTLRGPWGGMILSPEEHAKVIDKAVFPGAQGGPLMHAIAGKAAALRAWGQPEMEDYAQRVVANAQRLAQGLLQ